MMSGELRWCTSPRRSRQANLYLKLGAYQLMVSVHADGTFDPATYGCHRHGRGHPLGACGDLKTYRQRCLPLSREARGAAT